MTSPLQNLRQSVMARIMLIGLLTLLMLIPVASIENLIDERRERRDSAVTEVSEKWGGEQRIVGPILTVPYRHTVVEEFEDRGGKTRTRSRVQISQAYFLPESLEIGSDLGAEKRSRGIFDVVLYSTDLEIKSRFRRPNFRALKIPETAVLWSDARVFLEIPDPRGINGPIQTTRWNDSSIEFIPGTGEDEFGAGIHAPVNIAAGVGEFNFTAKLNLRGSQNIHFAPLGKETQVTMRSDWADPSFDGAFLPAEREVSPEGFTASWKVPYFGRSVPQQWAGGTDRIRAELSAASFGLRLLLPVDFYQKNTRAVKYAVLFLSLTFLSFFIFEIFSRLRIHPFQYTMVGATMCMFYVLFLSLSEHVGFNLAYGLAALAVIGMISAYAIAVLRQTKRAGIMAAMLTGLYGYLFVVLQSQDYSLLLGSVVLMIVLGVLMFITRNIDWYNVRLNADGDDVAPEKEVAGATS